MTTVNTMEDLMRLLDENPVWQEAVRVRILTPQLLELPEKFAQHQGEFVQHRAEFVQLSAEFVQHRAEFVQLSNEFVQLSKEFVQHRSEFLQLLAEFAQHRGEFAQLSKEFTRHREEFVRHQAEFVQHRAEFLKLSDAFVQHQGDFLKLSTTVVELQAQFVELQAQLIELRGEFNEHRREMREDLSQIKAAHALYMSSRMGAHFAQELGLQYRRRVEPEELTAITHNRTELTRAQRKSFNLSDLIFMAADEEGAERYVVVEVSYTANGRDSKRALEHAEILTRYTDVPAVAAVAGVRYTHELQPLFDSGQLHWLELETRDLESE